MRRVGALVRACHPEPTVAVTAVMTALAAASGRGPGATVLVGAAVLAGQLSIGWLNDAVDARRDVVAGRRDKPVATGVLSGRTVLVAAVTAAVVCVVLSLLLGPWVGALHLLAVAAGWVYDLGGKSTAWSVVPYVVCFGLLPVVAVTAPGAGWPPWWLPVGGALLGAGAHFANVLPDLADDAATGVRGLPHRIGAAGSRWAAGGALLAASVVLTVGVAGGGGGALASAVAVAVAVAVPPLALVVLLVGLRLGRRPGSRAPFRAVLVVALLDVVLLLVAAPTLSPA